MSISPCGVHDQTALVGADGLGEGSGALLDDDVSPSLCAGLRGVDLVAVGIMEDWHDDVALELGLADLSLNLTTVDGKIAKVGKEFLGAVLAADEVE